ILRTKFNYIEKLRFILWWFDTIVTGTDNPKSCVRVKTLSVFEQHTLPRNQIYCNLLLRSHADRQDVGHFQQLGPCSLVFSEESCANVLKNKRRGVNQCIVILLSH